MRRDRPSAVEIAESDSRPGLDARNAEVPCKIGTVPMTVTVHGADRIDTRKWVRIKEGAGDKWHRVYVTGLVADKEGRVTYFTADR